MITFLKSFKRREWPRKVTFLILIFSSWNNMNWCCCEYWMSTNYFKFLFCPFWTWNFSFFRSFVVGIIYPNNWVFLTVFVFVVLFNFFILFYCKHPKKVWIFEKKIVAFGFFFKFWVCISVTLQNCKINSLIHDYFRTWNINNEITFTGVLRHASYCATREKYHLTCWKNDGTFFWKQY